MYIPKAFQITDQKEIFSFINNNAFGQLVSLVNNKPFVSHIPFLLSEDGQTLIGHLAKQNPQHLEISAQEVLITFQGAHDYISPSWYKTPGVPTWNYQAVHVYGKCQVFSDTKKLKGVVDKLTEKYEIDYEKPWQQEYKAELLNAIIGLEIKISEIQCKYKLSQNRSVQDRNQVVKELEKKQSLALAEAMKAREG